MKKKLTISLIAVFLVLGVIFAIGALASYSINIKHLFTFVLLAVITH